MKKKLAIFGVLIAIIATIAYGSDIVQNMKWSNGIKSFAVTTKGDGTKFVAENPRRYYAGSTYNGVTITVTSAQSGWAVDTGSYFVPYVLADGQWRMKFLVYGTYTAATVGTITATINGVTFKNIGGSEPVPGFIGALGNVTAWKGAYAADATGDLYITVTSSGNTTYARWAGDVGLIAKPTWAN